MRTLREEVSRLSGIAMASLSNTPPSSGSTSNTGFVIDGNNENYTTQVKLIDGNYLKLYGLSWWREIMYWTWIRRRIYC